jgi:hypothetical protein
MLTKNGESKRDEVWYFGESGLGVVRIGDWKFVMSYQPGGWSGARLKYNAPLIHNLRRDPFERYPQISHGPGTGAVGSSDYYMSFFMREFWRFQFLQKRVAALAKTAIEFPPMQKGASFNLDAFKAQIEEAVKNHQGR